ncbi:MAG: HAMP domain-containing protein [Burkholderiales bacterium]|nr:HAMP domain-containing protein [Burkholderiales bacterium]
MILWPRTLLWRSVALIALLLVLAHLAWLQIFQASERGPRARQIARQIASIVNLTRAALISAQPARRIELLRDLSQEEQVQVYLARAGERVSPLPDRAFLRLIERDLRANLGPGTRFAVVRDGVPGAWVSFTIDSEEFWVRIPRARLERAEPVRWIWWGAVVLALALVGAWLVVLRINRPLNDLTRAAEVMGRGRLPPRVPETGPAEIATLARAFNQMAADLKRLDDERVLLLAGVSHDLRTPLSRIRLGLELIDGEADPALKAGMERDIEDIDGAINQFLDFARVTEGEPFDARGDLDAIVRAACEHAARGGSAVAMNLAPLPPVPLAPRAMRRLITNLIENAIRYGGPEVEVATGVAGGRAVIEVRDRGPGIPPDRAEDMLRPFTRLDAARTGPGTGLGLAIVERIARMHGGEVRLLAREGGGLRARVELPLPVRG